MATAARFTPSRHHLQAAVLAFAAAGFSAWCGLGWWPALVPAALLALTGSGLLYAALRPAIEIHELHLQIGRETITWNQIRRVDRTGWLSPLVLYLTLLNERRIQIFYPGDAESGQALLHHLRRNAREALIDGVPYRQFWGEILPSTSVKPPAPVEFQARSASTASASPKFRMLLAEDEEEIERMFQRLKTVGNLDPMNQSDKGK